MSVSLCASDELYEDDWVCDDDEWLCKLDRMGEDNEKVECNWDSLGVSDWVGGHG